MDTTNFQQMICQYEQTAQEINQRITLLKEQRKKDPFNNVKKLEERIAILEVEYSHLLKTARHMRDNYIVQTHSDIA